MRLSVNALGRSCLLVSVLLLTLPTFAQAPQQPTKSEDSSPETAVTFRSFTRLVTIQVVAKDRHGHHVTGLKPEDFEIYEEDVKVNKKHPEKIASFQEVHFADLAKQAPPPMKAPPGVYTNAVTLQKNPVPPTIILVDALNTKIRDQAQIHVQVERIVNAIPKNTPVAIFLLGSRLLLLQDFSTDPDILKAALKRASDAASAGTDTSPMSPSSASAQVDQARGHESDVTGATLTPIDAEIKALAEKIRGLELAETKLMTGMRVADTLESLVDIGHYVAGYPGRKNLLWISSSFPIKLNGLMFQFKTYQDDKGYARYDAQVTRAATVLSDAKVAVYPINPAGVQPHAIYGADAVPRDYSGPGMADAMSDEIGRLADQDRAMRMVADDTGGIVCNGSNDLGECLTRAFDDSSSYYEISYYPDSHDWNGDYRKIIVNSKRSGLHLEYRHGYFAGPAPGENPKAELQQAACAGYLDASSVVFAATKLPAQAPGELKFYMDVDPQTITLSPTSDGGRNFSIEVAACTFDKKGKPLQLLSQPISGKLNAEQYQQVAENGLTHVMAIPAPLPAGVRLVVKDVPTNHIGTVHVNLESVATAPKAEISPAKSQ